MVRRSAIQLSAERSGRVDAASTGAAQFARPDQTARLQHVDVLQDGGQRHVQRLTEFAHRRRAAAEPFDHEAPAGIGQRLEHPIQIGRIGKHALEYSVPRRIVKCMLQCW